MSPAVVEALEGLFAALRSDAQQRATVLPQELLRVEQDPQFGEELELYLGPVYLLTGMRPVVESIRRDLVEALAVTRAEPVGADA